MKTLGSFCSDSFAVALSLSSVAKSKRCANPSDAVARTVLRGIRRSEFQVRCLERIKQKIGDLVWLCDWNNRGSFSDMSLLRPALVDVFDRAISEAGRFELIVRELAQSHGFADVFILVVIIGQTAITF